MNVLNMCILLARNWHSSAKYMLLVIHKQVNSSLRRLFIFFVYNLSKYHEPSPHISYETSYLFIYSSFDVQWKAEKLLA